MASNYVKKDSGLFSGQGVLIVSIVLLFALLCLSLFVNLSLLSGPESDPSRIQNAYSSLSSFALAVIPNFFAGAMGYLTLSVIFRRQRRNAEQQDRDAIVEQINDEMRSISKEVHDEYTAKIDDIVDKIRYFDHASDWDGLTGSDKRDYQGNVYHKLEALLDEPHQELRIMSLSEVSDKLKVVYDRRRQYLKRIAKHIEEQSNSPRSYAYKRVFQLDDVNNPPKVVLEHRDDVLKAKGKNNYVNITVKGANLSQKRLHGLVLLDKKILAFIISGIDTDTGSMYPVALAVFKAGPSDNNRMIQYYASLFDDIADNQSKNLM
jgi:hypothetical protein